jgi:general stress protein 26
MGSNKSLTHVAAIQKMQEMFSDGQILIFCSGLGKFPVDATPMSTQSVDDAGNVWFFSSKDSGRNENLKKDPRSQLIYSNPSDMDFMSIHGKSEVMIDTKKAEEMWSKHVEVWFPEGPGDSNLTIIKFIPLEGYYWDTKHGKMISMAKWAAAMLTGSKNDDSIEGHLKL